MKTENPYEVVISGISGKFPESNNMEDFEDKLFSKTILLKNDFVRWNQGISETPYVSGKIPDSDRFDYTFFGLPRRLIHNCDPQMAQMLERTYEAILDAGVNPITIKGHNICVMAAFSQSDTEGLRFTQAVYLDGSGMVGLSRSMLANRISYCLNFTGPSLNINNSWLSAIQGLQEAATLVAQGRCEAAVVTSTNLLYHNIVETEYIDLNLLTRDRKCLPFDAKANGFARSEATMTFFLQRAEDAKRHYCTVLNSEVCYLGDKDTSFIKINPTLEQFYKTFYNRCKVNPYDVSYIEAFGCCDKDFDAKELNAVYDVFYNGESPVLVGSVSGNIGNTECPSGFVSLVKCVIAMEKGVIPPTVNYNTPNPKVPSLVSGQLKVVTETTALSRDLIAVNCLSLSGNLGHVLIKRHDKIKKNLLLGDLPPDGLPRLVVLQTRHEEGARTVLQKLSKMPVDTEFVSLVNDVFKTHVPNYLWRTYVTLPVSEAKLLQSKVESYPIDKRPVWFIFSGMGSQWLGMGTHLLQIPLFAASIDRCDRALAPHGININDILTTNNCDTLDNILNCFVGIASIQIGLVDILRAVGVTPDGMIGHSVGELGCAYADGCLTAEEMVLAAYCRGKASLESDNIKGLMAAVGLGFNDIKDQLPPSIDVACHNSNTSCTLSGPTEDMLQYVSDLKNKGVFAKAVSAGGIAYHSRYIKEIGHKLLTYLQQVIQSHKPRSARWVSSSVPQAEWDTPEAQLCSAEYHTNNLLNPVLFEEAIQHLPKNAILIEIAPHGLLQAILRRSCSLGSITLSLTNKSADSNVLHLLDVLGRLHNQGVDLDVNALYPPVDYPVSRGTPSLVDLATWDHSEKHFFEIQDLAKMLQKGSLEITYQTNTKNPDYGLWRDHCINDSVVLPISQLLIYPWKMAFHSKLLDIENNCVVFEDVTITNDVAIKTSNDSLLVTITPENFSFEVSTPSYDYFSSDICLKGKLHEAQIPISSSLKLSEIEQNSKEVNESEIYSLLAYFGCQLGPQFKCVKKITLGKRVCVAEVQWTGNLVTFLDGIFKVLVFIHTEKIQNLMHPSSFIRLSVNPNALRSLPPNTIVQVFYDRRSNRLVCEAVELCGITLRRASGGKPPAIYWREVKLQAHGNIKSSVEEILSTSIQLASQARLSPWATKKSSPLNILVLKDKMGTSNTIINVLHNVANTLLNISVKIQEGDFKDAKHTLNQTRSQACLVVGHNDLTSSLIDTIMDSNIYWLTYSSSKEPPKYNSWIQRIMSFQSKEGQFSLLKRICIDIPLSEERVFEVQGPACVGRLRERMAQDNSSDHVVVVSSDMTPRHLLPILASEPYAHRLCTVFILDKKAPTFSVKSPFYNNMICLGLPLNVLSNGAWSSLISNNVDVSPRKHNIDRLFESLNKVVEKYCIGLNSNNFTLYQDVDIEQLELKCVDYSGYMGEQRVMGVAQCDSVFSLTPDPILKWSVPSHWTLEEAATVPVIYTLAYYCVHVKGRLQAGEDVLVHAAMSPLAQAVVGIALHMGANVFATVTSDKEVTALLDLYPSLSPQHVRLLGSKQIYVVISNSTAGKGVELVVNCLRGDDMKYSIKVMGITCRFLHLGHIKIEDRDSFGMGAFIKNTSFFGISLANIKNCNHETKVELQDFVQAGVEKGLVKPLRMATFSLEEEANALLHLKGKYMFEKTILIKNNGKKLYSKHMDDYCCTGDERVILLGSKSQMWQDVAEWLVLRGARNFVVITEDDYLRDNLTPRYRKLTKTFKTNVHLFPESKILTPENSLQVLEEIGKFGQIAYIFCIQQDESSTAMRNLDFASRRLVPELRQFVTLLCEGTLVSESRAASGLPVCSIQSSTPLQNPAHVLPYLTTLPADTSSNSRFFLVTDMEKGTEEQEYLDIQSFLPSSLDELCGMADDVSETPVFREEVTRSPGYQFVRHSLLPVFVVSGLGPHTLRPLLRQILHPVFCCSLPERVTYLSEYAETLLQEVLKIQNQGTYNLVGTSWGGPVALTLATLLESRGHRVKLILLEGAPTIAQDRVKGLCERYNSDLASSLLAETLKLSLEVMKRVTQSGLWNNQLREALLEAKMAGTTHDSGARSLTYLHSLLKALLHQNTPSQIFRGDLVLITCKPISEADKKRFTEFCEESPNTMMVEDESYSSFLTNSSTAAAVNENLAYDWDL